MSQARAGGAGTRCSEPEEQSRGPCQAPDCQPEVAEARWPESSGQWPGEVPEGRGARSQQPPMLAAAEGRAGAGAGVPGSVLRGRAEAAEAAGGAQG